MYIKIRRHRLMFWGFISLVLAFCLFFGTGLLMAYLNQKQENFTLTGVVFSYSLGVFAALLYFINVPVIRVDNETIFFGRKKFLLSDIDEIKLHAKVPARYNICFSTEGGYIKFQNGVTRYFYDDMYSNLWELKQALSQHMKLTAIISNSKEFPQSTAEIQYQSFEKYKGNQFLSFRGLLMWPAVLMISYACIFKMRSAPPIVFIVFLAVGIFWFLFNSWMMHYFKLNSQYLIVKNNNLLWVNSIYPISQLKEIVFECENYNQPNSLRVITKDFKSKKYPAGTLSDKTWLSMKKHLESLGIPVRNECIV